MNRKNNNYDVLDKILEEAGHPNRQGAGKRWYAPDPDKPDDGMWITETVSADEIRQQNDAIEKYLRS